MASAMRVFRKFRASDGRIKIATLSGVSALVAVIALLVGVLPVMADHENPEAGPLVEAQFVKYGGGPGACAFVESAADFEAHDNNPSMSKTITGPDGTEIKIVVDGQTFDFEVLTPGMAVYDVVVNGGPHNNLYDYDGLLGHPVDHDQNLHAPKKNNGDFNNLSHINICYDVRTVDFVCDATEPTSALHFGDGSFEGATATILTNKVNTCTDKSGFFFIDGNEATLDFGDSGTVAGRADYTKSFDSPTDPTENFEDLEYDGPGEFVDLQWCEIRPKEATKGDGHQFDDVLASDEYPSLSGVDDTLDDGGTPEDTSDDTTVQATACKVAEIENAAGTQVTVVYFEFEDPNFR